MTYRLAVTPAARRGLAALPLPVAAAVVELCSGPLVEDPHRVGKPLTAPLDGVWSARRGQYRVLYRIDDAQARVVVVSVRHRRDAYRS